jgi:hypothetical protein
MKCNCPVLVVVQVGKGMLAKQVFLGIDEGELEICRILDSAA